MIGATPSSKLKLLYLKPTYYKFRIRCHVFITWLNLNACSYARRYTLAIDLIINNFNIN